MEKARRLSINEAATRLQVSPQGAREMIKAKHIPGASCWGSKKHMTYYITDEQIDRFMKGIIG